MPSPTQLIVVCLVSYLIGAIPFGFLIARWRGVDILHKGSGNIGATNVGRVLGKRYGILVFLLDFAKGAGPTLAAPLLAGFEPVTNVDALRVAAGLAAFTGHIFPVFLLFRGGKGVATGAGVVAILLPWPAGAAFLTWIVVVFFSRYVSLASLAAVTMLCIVHLVTTPEPFTGEKRILTVFCFIAAGLVFLRHRSNIARLLAGKENRI